MQRYLPEGMLQATVENRALTSEITGLESALQNHQIIEGTAVLCDESLSLHVDLGGEIHGLIPREEVLYHRSEEPQKEIAVISRVGKPVCARVIRLEYRVHQKPVAILSRRMAQEDCRKNYLSGLRPGDLIPARVTHLEPFGAFLDIGCGMISLLSVDCISVSRLAHPRDRLSVGMDLTVAVKSIDPESGRIYVTLRELLGTWKENAAQFHAGQTVTGILRSVENYGVFIELAPNLAGLAEIHGEHQAAELRACIGKGAAVYIKSILPERMKIKLVLIDYGFSVPRKKELPYFIRPDTAHLSRWLYTPPSCGKIIETIFE